MRSFAPAALLLALAACQDARGSREGDSCPTWQEDVGPAVDETCAGEGCHAGDAPAGGYALDSYLAALGPGSDGEPNAIAGDPDSPIVAELDPEAADAVHEAFTELEPLIRQWVVECELAHRRSRIHERGILNPRSSDFHGELLRQRDWAFAECADCHGEDFGGGSAEASCLSCHEDGPTDCATCHGDVPETGAHETHALGGPLDKRYDCGTCHTVPERWDDPGHILLADGTADDAPAEIAFAAVAGEGASYDPASSTCSGVACHGAELDDPAASLTEPRWDAGEGQAACGTCHGDPPADHADDRCSVCHPQGGLEEPALHVNGTLEVGQGCDGCHGGDLVGPAPPPDLLGRVSAELVTVGAHRAHVTGASRLTAPIGCDGCHREPAEVDAPGHIDSAAPAEVFPGDFAGLASAGGAAPTWDRQSATCADVYCHGGGTRQADDTAAGLERQPDWTAANAGEAACGRCHGVPPIDGSHDPGLGLTDCATCHPATVDDFGNILIGPPQNPVTEHIDGEVDVTVN